MGHGRGDALPVGVTSRPAETWASDELAPAYLVPLWVAVAVLRRPVLRVHDPSRTAGHYYVKPTGER